MTPTVGFLIAFLLSLLPLCLAFACTITALRAAGDHTVEDWHLLGLFLIALILASGVSVACLALTVLS